MKSTKKRKRKRKTGTKPVVSRRILLALLPGVLLSAAARGSDKPKSRVPAPYGIVGGTVFRDSGFALPGAEVALKADPENGERALKPQRAVTDARGEFAFRVPAAAMRYRISASAKGFVPQEKEVFIQGEERTDVTLTLAASSNK